MALTRKFLSALGIEADKIDEIIDAHVETVNALKAERDEAKASGADVASLRAELDEANKKLEEVNKDGYKGKFEALKAEHEKFKADVDAKALLDSKDKAYRSLLKGAGVSEKRIDSIIKVTDLNSLELDGDGLKNADQLTESIKTEWADFVVSNSTEGAGTNFPPKEEGKAGAPNIPLIF